MNYNVIGKDISALFTDLHFFLVSVITNLSRKSDSKDSTFANFSHLSYTYIHEIYLL